MFMTGEVEVELKTREILKGTLMSVQEVQALYDHFPLVSLFDSDGFKDGFFVFTGHTIIYLDQKEIKRMTGLNFG